MAPLWRTPFVGVFFILLSLTAHVAADDDDDDDDNVVTTTLGPDFNGWQFQIQDGRASSVPVKCGDDQFYSSSGDYVHCCYYGQECQMATKCNGNTQLFADGSEEDCGDGWLCKTMTVFEAFPAEGPIYTDVFCGQPDWDIHTVYRTIPTPSRIDPTPISTAEPRGGSSSTPTPTATTISPPADPSPPPTPEPPTSKPSPNAGLIAGAVVGPVIGLLLIAIALWLIRDKIKSWFRGSSSSSNNSNNPDYTPAPQPGAGVAGAGAYADDIKPGPAGYGYAPPHGIGMYGPSELDSTTAPPPVIYELPAPFVENPRPVSQELPVDTPRPVSELSPGTATATATRSPSPVTPVPDAASPVTKPVS